MRLKYNKYNFANGVEKIKTRTAIVLSAVTLAVAGGSGMSLALSGSAHAEDSAVTVTTANPQGWAFFDDSGNGGTGMFVDGPGTPLIGAGSAQLALTAANQGYALGNAMAGGTRLGAITDLSYSTYVQTGNNTVAPALQLNIDSDVTDANTSWQGRLVYEPYYTQTVTDGTWQTWNTQDDSQNGDVGNWWFSNGTLASNTGCTQATPCTWSEVLTALPNAGINATDPGVVFKAGSNWAIDTFTGNVDAFVFGTAEGVTTYNFEAQTVETPTVPTVKADCQDEGWMTFTGDVTFKNQGQCVAYVNHHDGVGKDDQHTHNR
jgi:hypothetical protein